MNVILTAIKEIYGLFVEDGSYATSIVVWVLVTALVFPHLPALGLWRAPLLFVGLLFLLVENVRRTARK
jgi:hypothetical protein